MLDQIVATILAQNLELHALYPLMSGPWLDAVVALCTSFGGLPSYSTLREHIDSARKRAVTSITDQLHTSANGLPPVHGVMSDASSDAHGHAINNTIVQLGALGTILVGSSAVADDRKLGADESAVHIRTALRLHDLAPASPTNVAQRKLRGAQNAHPCGQHLDHQLLSGICTDNCNSALATATEFIDCAAQDVHNTFSDAGEGEERKPIVMDDETRDNFTFVKEGCPAHGINLLAGADVWAFFVHAKELLESWATLAGTQSRKRKHRLIAVLGDASARRALDSDGQRWGDRMRALALLFSGEEDEELTWDKLLAWLKSELNDAREEKNENVAVLRKAWYERLC
jgi:hypothetical protein